jgi:hypothetical protein
MKRILFILLLALSANFCTAQVLKKIGQKVKDNVGWRAERRVGQEIDRGLDSLLRGSKKKAQKKDQKSPGTKPQTSGPKGTIPGTAPLDTKTSETKEPEGDQNAKSAADAGFITLFLSTPITTRGLSVDLYGESIKHDKWKNAALRIQGPDVDEKSMAVLTEDGKYYVHWSKLPTDGNYTITATSSDGKMTSTAKLWVMDWTEPEDENQSLIKETSKAFQRLQERGDAVKGMIGRKDAAILDEKIKAIKENLDALHKLLNSLTKAKQNVGGLLKSGKGLPLSLATHLTELNKKITGKVDEVKKLSETKKHEAADNTVCEYITMVNEACAAFSTLTNFWTLSVRTLIKNITLDKGVPKAVETVNKGRAPAEMEWSTKEVSKIYATSLLDADGLNSKLGKAGFAGDVMQFAADVLLKVHCGVYKGKLTHSYRLISRNIKHSVWWDYTVESEAAITLRYPKKYSGTVIKMKGNIEGNATRFKFFADPKLNPSYIEYEKTGEFKTQMIKSYTPVALSVASSLHDELGFGAAARGLATPGYFNIPFDAEYDTDTEKIKFFLNEALLDFTDAVFNRQFFIQWVKGLPKLRMIDYPINKARLTINGSMLNDSEFDMQRDSKGNLFFKEDIKRIIGSEVTSREHMLKTSIEAKKE